MNLRAGSGWLGFVFWFVPHFDYSRTRVKAHKQPESWLLHDTECVKGPWSWVKETFCIPKLCITSSDALVIQLWEKFSTSSGQLFWARSIPGSIIGIVVLGSVRAKLASNSGGLLLNKLLVWDALFHKSTRNLQLLIWLLHSNMMLRLQPLEHATFFSSFAIFCL